MASELRKFWPLLGGVAVSLGMAIPSRMKHMKKAPRSFPKLFPRLCNHVANIPHAPASSQRTRKVLLPGMQEGCGRRTLPRDTKLGPLRCPCSNTLRKPRGPRALTIPRQELSISIVVMTKKSEDIDLPPRDPARN
jgi:hypothetical protein